MAVGGCADGGWQWADGGWRMAIPDSVILSRVDGEGSLNCRLVDFEILRRASPTQDDGDFSQPLRMTDGTLGSPSAICHLPSAQPPTAISAAAHRHQRSRHRAQRPKASAALDDLLQHLILQPVHGVHAYPVVIEQE